MGLADNYWFDTKSPLDAMLGGVNSWQVMKQNDSVLEQNRIANQAAQDKADYLKQAQQEAQTLDYNDPNAIRQFIAKYESTGLTKGMTDYVANLDTNERQGMLADTSKALSLINNGDIAGAEQLARSRAQAYINAKNPAKAAEYNQVADMIKANPNAALQHLQWNMALLAPKDASGNYKDMLGATTPTVKEFNSGGATNAYIIDPITKKITVQKLADNTVDPTKEAEFANRKEIQILDNDGKMKVARINAAGQLEVANANGTWSVRRENVSQTGQNYRQAKTMQQEDNQVEIREVGGYMLRLYGKNGSRGVDVIGKAATVTGANGQKPLTEAQSNAYLFGTRMQANHKILTDFESKGINGSIAQHLFGDNKATNFASRPEHQQYAQAKRDFINAVMRKESGAAIGKDEFASADKQYFPQIGDSPAVIQQKQQAREQAIKGIMAAIPQGFQGNYPAASAPPSSIAKPQQQGGYISNKYK